MFKKIFTAKKGDINADYAKERIRPLSITDSTNKPIIGIIGAKGGVGATSLAVNLATKLSMLGNETTLVDANLQQPNIAHLVGKEPDHSLFELLARPANIDRQLFDACSVPLIETNPNLRLLSPKLESDLAVKANLSQLVDCLNVMRPYTDFWIIDLPKYLDKHLVMLADYCDKILLVFEATVPGVASCRRWLSIFHELGYPREKIICILNRAGSKYIGVEKQLTDCFVDETIFRVPNASAVAWECSTRGVPIVLAHPNHPYSEAIAKLANYISQSIFTEQANV